MITTPTPEAVARYRMVGYDCGMAPAHDGHYVCASDYDALLARVDALTKERDSIHEAYKDKIEALGREVNAARYGHPDFAWSIHEAAMADLVAERDAALAASGAVAEAMRDRCADMVEREGHSLHVAIRHAPIPTDAAAALADHDKRVIADYLRTHREFADVVSSCPYCGKFREHGHECAAILARKEG